MKSIFEKIIDREIPANIIYENEYVIGISDIAPVAPHHYLIIPKQYVRDIQSVTDMEIFGHIGIAIQEIAIKTGLIDKGYRVISNVGKWGGQTVPHLHYHLIGGKPLHALISD